MLHTYFPYGSLELLLDSKYLYHQLSKILGHWVSNELPWETTLHTCCHNSLMEKLSVFWAVPLGENS